MEQGIVLGIRSIFLLIYKCQRVSSGSYGSIDNATIFEYELTETKRRKTMMWNILDNWYASSTTSFPIRNIPNLSME